MEQTNTVAASPTIEPGRATAASERTAGDGWRTLAALLLIGGAIGAIYYRTVEAPFIFDDCVTVQDNPSTVRLWPLIGTTEFPGPLNAPQDYPTCGRPLVNFTLALNYYFGALEPVGYHLVNMVIHLLSAMLLMAIVRRTLHLDYFGGRFDSAAWPLSVVVALLWAIHPLQSEAVVYVTQRTELMVGLFYLSTLYASLRYFTSPLPLGEGRVRETNTAVCPSPQPSPQGRGRIVWLILATLACLAGMASKEVMVSAPIVVLLFERAFLAGSVREAWRRSWPLYLGLACGWVLLFALNISGPRSHSAGFHVSLPLYQWWLTQTEMLLMYLRLSVWPAPLAIYYGTPYLTTFAAAWPSLVLVSLLAITTLVLLWRNWPTGFLATSVWLILAPTLIVPIITEIAAERRMYLSLAALIVWAVVGGYTLLLKLAQAPSPAMDRPATRRWPIGAVVIVSLVLCSVSYFVGVRRLAAYVNEATLWQDAALHQPLDPVIQNNLGSALFSMGQIEEARQHYQEATRLKPDYAVAQKNLGGALVKLDRPQEALEQFRLALVSKPDFAEGYFAFGCALFKLERPQEAIEKFEHALRLKPDYPEAHNTLAGVLFSTNRIDEAIAHCQEALRLKPAFPAAHCNLANSLVKTGRFDEGIEQYEQTLRLKPDFPKAEYLLGVALCHSNRPQQALEHFAAALRIDPEHAEAHSDWAGALVAIGQPQQAIAHCQEALRLKPDYAEAHCNFGTALSKLGKSDQAIEHFRESVRLKPDYAEAHNDLGGALFNAGQIPEAAAHFQEAVRLMPELAQAHCNLGAALLSVGRTGEAVQQFEEALRLKPDHADAHYNLGNALLMSGHSAEAVEHYQRALQSQPDSADIHCNLAQSLLEIGRLPEAIDHFQQAVRKSPDFTDAWANLAEALARSGKMPQAQAAAQQALSLARAQGQTALVEQINGWLASHSAAAARTDVPADTNCAPSP